MMMQAVLLPDNDSIVLLSFDNDGTVLLSF